jgi:two-component system LytT family response regulator
VFESICHFPTDKQTKGRSLMIDAQALVRTLIVEDEPHARHYLGQLLADEPRVAIVGEASSGAGGADLVRKLSPDLVFLDIQMPDLSGFDLITEIGVEKMPAFIFVTAYSEYAVHAFEVEAVDYLCKPFDRDRLSASLERAMRRLHLRNAEAAENGVGALHDKTDPWLSRIPIKERNGIVFVPVDGILWIEAADKYVELHTADRSYLARQTIQSLEESLDPKQFVRIHRSTIVRKAAVRGLHPLFHGDYVVRLNNGTELTLSRNFRESFFTQMSR